MTARAQHRDAPPPSVRWRVLRRRGRSRPRGGAAICLMLGLLAGLFAMHGLAPGGAVLEHSAPRHMTAAVATHDDCAGDDCGGGHARHADQTCASGALSGRPTLPALAADPVAVPAPSDAPCPYAGTAPDGARAPPSLAELQLLRI